MIKIAGIVLSVAIGMGAVSSVSAAVGDVTVTTDASGVTSTFVETAAEIAWVPSTYTQSGSTYTQVSEGSEDYSNGSGSILTGTNLAAAGFTLNPGSATIDAVLVQVTGDVTLSGSTLTFANGATLDLAGLTSSSIAEVSYVATSGYLTFKNSAGVTLDSINIDGADNIDGLAFIIANQTIRVTAQDGSVTYLDLSTFATDVELATTIGSSSTGTVADGDFVAATGVYVSIEANTSAILTEAITRANAVDSLSGRLDTVEGSGAGSIAKAQF